MKNGNWAAVLTDFEAILSVYASENGLTLAELSVALNKQMSVLCDSIEKLQRRKFVELQDTRDGGRPRLKVGAEGEKFLLKFYQAVQEMEKRLGVRRL